MGRAQRPPCFQCRCRKVRCDRRPGCCVNCERLDFACSFKKNTSILTNRRPSPKETVQNRPERRRGTQACIECRRQKARCSGELPECTNCHRRQRSCQYPQVNQSNNIDDNLVEVRQPEQVPGDTSVTSSDELFERINAYFQYLYPIPSFAFLHEPTIRQQCESGTLDHNLATSITTTVDLWLPKGQKPAERISLCIDSVEQGIWNQLDRPCIRQLQCLMLIVHCHIHLGRFSRAYMLAGLAGRAVTALRLNYERPELSFIAQETRRRVLWALTSIDGFFSVGLPEYETIPHAIIYQRLPSSEEAFREGTPQSQLSARRASLSAASAEDGGLLADCIQLSKISKDIMRLTRQLALSEQPMLQLGGLIKEIQNDLLRFQSDVELSFGHQVAALANIEDMARSRWFARILQVTATWHQAHCDLYRLFLPNYQAVAPRIIMDTIEPSMKDHALVKCEEHVQHLNHIMRELLRLPKEQILPRYIAVCAYHATRLSLFLAASPDFKVQTDTATAFKNAEISLSVLQKFFSNIPSTDRVIQDMQDLVRLSHDRPGAIYKELCCPSPPFDEGRHRHSHLAVHSLVRQANFVDDGYEESYNDSVN
ncbi:unnamed protein product [Penicillium pancosmium]